MKRDYTVSEKMQIRRILAEARSPLTFQQILDNECNGHSFWGASGWDRAMICAGSAIAEVGMPDNSGYDAAEGTVAHMLAERALVGLHVSDYVGLTHKVGKHVVKIDDEMCEYVQQYVAWCREGEGVEFVEQHVDLSDWTPIPNQGGTADYAKCRVGHLTITDFKFGKGVQVYAKENPQATGYALGFIKEWTWLFDFDTVTIRICQPRLGHFDVWETDVEYLSRFGLVIKESLAKGLRPDATRTPSEKGCKFCKAISRCSAVLAIAERLADGTFHNETVSVDAMHDAGVVLNTSEIKMRVAPRALSTSQLVRFLDYQKLFEKAFTEVYNELQRRVMAGEVVPEWFMAEGRKTRSIPPAAWKKVCAAVEASGGDSADLWTVDFASPAEIEAHLITEAKLKKKHAEAVISPFVTVTTGDAKLARKRAGRVAALDLSLDSFEAVNPDDDI